MWRLCEIKIICEEPYKKELIVPLINSLLDFDPKSDGAWIFYFNRAKNQKD